MQSIIYRAVQSSEPVVEGITRGHVVQQILIEREQGTKHGLKALVQSAAKRLEAGGNGDMWAYTRRHSLEVGFFSYIMAAQAKRHNTYPDCPDPKLIYLGGILHDIGKTLLPMSLIVKEVGVKILFLKLFEGRSMNDIERRVLRDEHLSAGTRYVRLFGGNGQIKTILDMVGLHHVMYNGKDTVVPSYPSLFKGEDLPPQARIAKTADFLSAVQPRHYREESWIHDLQSAIAYSLAVAGMELDPRAVACFITGTHDIEMEAALEMAERFVHPDGQRGISSYESIKGYIQSDLMNDPEFLELMSRWDKKKVHNYEIEASALARQYGFPVLGDISPERTWDDANAA